MSTVALLSLTPPPLPPAFCSCTMQYTQTYNRLLPTLKAAIADLPCSMSGSSVLNQKRLFQCLTITVQALSL